jgi:Cu-Zn family superoxide dismutase
MRNLKLNNLKTGILICCLALFSCTENVEKKAIANLYAKSDSNVSGTLTFTEINGKVMMKATIKGLTPGGTNAIHIHENGDCSSDDGTSAGGHWNPSSHDHGKWKEGDFHSGDIGNLEADENGVATIEKESDFWAINGDDETKNIVGKGIIVHAGVDDFKSQPSGAAGARIACGVIEIE